jgi:hypothetical protein
MSVIWSGVTEEGAVVPVQVTAEGKVVAVGDGPEGDYLKLTGGNLTGDLTVNEQITLATNGSAELAGGKFEVRSSGAQYMLLTGEETASAIRVKNDDTWKAVLTGGGRLTLGGDASSLPTSNIVLDGPTGSATFSKVSIEASGYIQSQRRYAGDTFDTFLEVNTSDGPSFLKGSVQGGDTKFQIKQDGSAMFSGGKCGFTADGEIFFTSRNSRYKLLVQGELVVAEPYTREMELKEKAEKFIADKRETKPSDPAPSDSQSEVGVDNDNA